MHSLPLQFISNSLVSGFTLKNSCMKICDMKNILKYRALLTKYSNSSEGSAIVFVFLI